MNKKVNTLLFIMGATLYNMLITVLAFWLLLLAYARFIERILPEGAQVWAFPLIFIASMVIAFIIYRYTIKLLIKKIDVEKYFDPIINRRYKPRPRF